MKILLISDRSPRSPIKETLLREGNIDIIITLWDLEYSLIRELAEVHDIPKIWVYGNHCSGRYFEDLGIINMHLKTFVYQGITFGWFEGCVRYKPNPDAIMYTQEEAEKLISQLPKVDIILSHCPPRWINDEDEISHQGYDALRKYCQKYNPQYLFHGHTYPEWDTLVTKFWETNIIYVYADKVVDIELI